MGSHEIVSPEDCSNQNPESVSKGYRERQEKDSRETRGFNLV